MFDNNYNHKEDRTEDDYDDDQEETETESITIVESTEPKHKLFEFLMDNSYFKSLQEVKIFNNDNNNISTIPLSSFAIVKFSNHLDVDILIKKYNKYVPNISIIIPIFHYFLINILIEKKDLCSQEHQIWPILPITQLIVVVVVVVVIQEQQQQQTQQLTLQDQWIILILLLLKTYSIFTSNKIE